MAIEFRCSACGKLLRTPDGTAGKTAKCPQCGALVTIAESGSTGGVAQVVADEPVLAATAPPPPPGGDNPYQSPTTEEMRVPHEVRRGFNPSPLDLGETLGRAWTIYKANFGLCVVGGLLLIIVSGLTSYAINSLKESDGMTAGLVSLVGFAVNTWLSLGYLRFLLNVTRGANPSLGDIFSGGPYVLPGLAVAFIVSLATFIGFCLLIIPGIIVALMLSQAQLLVVEGHGIVDSLQMSMQATKGNKLTMLLLYFVTAMIVGLGMLLTCFIGSFLVIPYAALVYVVAYLMMTGQSTAAG